jgi:hypothetical protein
MRKCNVLSISWGGLQQRNVVEKLHENWSKMGKRERKTEYWLPQRATESTFIYERLRINCSFETRK